MNNQLALSKTVCLLAADSENDIKQTARKLMHLTPGGHNLDANQAADLAVYAYMTGFNPFNGECYYMDKIGPTAGVAGYRVKTQEWLEATAPQNSIVRLWEEYRPAQPNEADFNPDAGDVAWHCTLYDSVSKERWQQGVLQHTVEYIRAGVPHQEAHEMAKSDIGLCPCWTAVGVVKAEEHYSANVWDAKTNKKIEDEYRPEMWDRNERAKKRAAKGCYRKGFPAVRVPDREMGDEIVDAVAVEVKDRIIHEIAQEAEQPRKTAAQLIAELGFGTDEPKTEQPEPTPDAQTQAEMHAETVSGSLEAYQMDSDGHPYDEMDAAHISYYLNGLLSAKNADPLKAQKVEYLKKLLAARNGAK